MDTLGDVLQLVNQARVALGAWPVSALPQGRVRANDGCVIARLLDAHVECASLWFDTEDEARRVALAWGVRPDVCWPAGIHGPRFSVPLPADLVRFCRDFDNWRYPNLVEIETGSSAG
jgi:hypothetical protein